MTSTSLLDAAASLSSKSFDEIPIIDLSLSDEELVDSVREACLVAGFFYVKNHSVPEELVNVTFDYARKFFRELDDEEKMKIHISKSNNFEGYMGLMSENTDPANRGDLHEAFNVSREHPSDPPNLNPVLDAEGKHGENMWPDEELDGGKLEGFRIGVLTYFQEILSLGKRLFPLFALALGLPRDFFDDKTQNMAAIMRLLFYPPQTGPQDDRVLGIGAHTDYECFTILRQFDGVEALQVLNKQGVWISAPPIPGTFVINIADQLARWSNDIFVSTRHRAINRSGAERFSIPFFFGTDHDVSLVPFSTCVSEARPARYEPILAGDYVRGRLEETYSVSVGGYEAEGK
ncbi:hypothetical protein BDY24DRAFT_390939 [Mrakia frigida]|uniref:isopenicillin N synthase family dioxygenase n=1 Tax=Mrakia frigida TaxID=29902 RepID=UPI003FCC175C